MDAVQPVVEEIAYSALLILAKGISVLAIHPSGVKRIIVMDAIDCGEVLMEKSFLA